MASPPVAPRRPHVVSAHGDDREDPWYWLREREDPEVLAYLEAENAYTEEEMAPLDALRDGLFEEMKARIKETDMSVPARRGPWWYYTRTEEGKSYAIHCRRPARGREELPPAGEPGGEEQILLDENALAEGSEYFAVGSAAVSHDHRWLAYATDRAGNEKYELRFRPLDAETPPDAGRRVGARHRLRAGLVGRGRLRLLRPPRRGAAAPPALAPPAGHRPRRATTSSSRSPTAASRSARGRPATPPSCSSACTAPTPPSGSPSRRPTRSPSRWW